jgi:hypothetical protein
VKERGGEREKERDKDNNKKIAYSLFTIHTRRKIIYSAYSGGGKKSLIIVKLNYFEAFD